MNKIEQLRSQYAEIVAKMRGILDKADEEERDLTEEETRSYEQFEADSEKIKAQVAREERLSVAELEMRRRIDDPLRPPVTNAPPDKKEFKSLGEFLYAVRFTPTDPRLMELREQQMVVGESGGFAVPPAFIPTLLQGWNPSILFVGSVCGLTAWEGDVAYNVAKAGLHHLARCIATDYAKAGLRANAIAPGIIDTPLVRNFAGAMPGGEEAGMKALAAMHPMGRYAEVTEVSEAAAFLSSDKAGFITGAVLPIDGGFTMV